MGMTLGMHSLRVTDSGQISPEVGRTGDLVHTVRVDFRFMIASSNKPAVMLLQSIVILEHHRSERYTTD
jgi:hypothetical protein